MGTRVQWISWRIPVVVHCTAEIMFVRIDIGDEATSIRYLKAVVY
jgi:hypothetical protein